MEPFQMISAAWLAAGGLAFVAVLWAAFRALRLRRPAPSAPAAASEALIHRLELRMEAMEATQSALAARIEALGGDDASERRLQAVAGQILGLVRDKNARLDTALAGLDQIRARLRVLEQIGAPAEALALLERLGARLDTTDSTLAAACGALEARLAALEGAAPPFAEISKQLTRLYAQKDATAETVFARLAPLEAKLGELERTGDDEDAAAARAEALAIAAQLIAARTVAEETRLFADRISLLEASLPRLSMAQALMMQALERQAAASAPERSAPGGVLEGAPRNPGQDAVEETEEDALWRLPRVVSVHKT